MKLKSDIGYPIINKKKVGQKNGQPKTPAYIIAGSFGLVK